MSEQRIIKFRIYMKSEKRMLYNPYVQDIQGNRDQINDFFNGKNNKYIWMQYTGLKDKTGKDIYEGDIISYKYFKGFSGVEKEIRAEVKFQKGSFGFYEYQRADDEYFDTYSLPNTIVIGNIYENKELLEMKDESSDI